MKFSPLRRIPGTTALLSFELVSRSLSITQASGDLCVSPGAVSRQISELEAFLGTPLFHRRKQRLALTAAGAAYAKQIRPLLDQMEQATLAVRSRREDNRHLHLSIAATFGNRWLLPKLADFYVRHRDVVLDISTRVGMPDFDAMRLDAALVYCEAPPAGFDATRIYPLRLMAVAASRLFKGGKVPKGLATFERLPLIEQSTVPRAWNDYFQAMGEPMPPHRRGPRFDLLSMGHEVTLAGLGIALLPAYLVDEDLRSGRLVRVHPQQFETAASYQLLYPEGLADRPGLKALREWMLAQAAAFPPPG